MLKNFFSISRWTHVVVDSVTGKHGVYNVVFIATADGRIRKLMKHPVTGETCLIEEIKIVPNGEPKPVKAMKIYPKEVKYYSKASLSNENLSCTSKFLYQRYC